MNLENILFNHENKINLERIITDMDKPELFSKGEELFWDDPYIAEQMLKAHLDAAVDAASYKEKRIKDTVTWLVPYLKQRDAGDLLDLGCGPGLYCTRFHANGLRVTGMDYSKNSIEYAKTAAEKRGFPIKYIYQDYLTINYREEFDVITLIYCDFGVLSDKAADILLQKIKMALKPGGVFIFDVFTGIPFQHKEGSSWYGTKSGFWRPYPHLVLEKGFHYEEEQAFLTQYTVIEETGRVVTYKLWDHYYTPDTISNKLRKHGFHIQDIWGDLTGKPFKITSKTMGVAAVK